MSTKPRKLSIAFVYDDTLDGNDGVAQYVKNLGGWLSRRGHRVSYFVGETEIKEYAGGEVFSLSKNIRVKFNGNGLSMPLMARGSSIKRALKSGPDLLHVQVPYSPFMAGRVISKSQVPMVGTFHIFPANRLASIGSRLLKLAYFKQLNKFSKIVAVSPAAATFARQAFGLKTEPSSNLVNLAAFTSKIHNQPYTIVFLGRLVPRKGCRQLIEAFALTHQLLPQAKLIIGGGGPQRAELEKLVARLNLSKAVEFRGFIPEDKKADLLAGATIACFPSLHGESFGIVLIEAMAAGAGVTIGGNNQGYRTVLSEKPELLFDPADKEKLAGKLVKLLSDDKLREQLHHWQTKHVVQYDVEVVGRQMEKIYHQAIAKDAARRHNSN